MSSEPRPGPAMENSVTLLVGEEIMFAMHAMAETGDHERLTRVLKSMPAGTFEPEDNNRAAGAGLGASDSAALAQKRRKPSGEDDDAPYVATLLGRKPQVDDEKEDQEDEEDDEDDDDEDNEEEDQLDALKEREPQATERVKGIIGQHLGGQPAEEQRAGEAAPPTGEQAFNDKEAPLVAAIFRAYLNVADDFKQNPLHLAVLNGHVEAARVLLAHGSKVNRSCETSTSLHMAACLAALPDKQEVSEKLVSMLLEVGADTQSRDYTERLPLHWAAVYGNARVCSVLATKQQEQLQAVLEARAAAGKPPAAGAMTSVLEAVDSELNTPIHLAAKYGHVQALATLLNQGQPYYPNPSILSERNRSGDTPLLLAAKHGHQACVEKLVASVPADKKNDLLAIRDNRGIDAIGTAARRGHKEIAEYLAKESSSAAPTLAAQEGARGTLVIAPHACWLHCPLNYVRGGKVKLPPENWRRLSVLAQQGTGILRGRNFNQLTWLPSDACPAAQLVDVIKCHEWGYVQNLSERCRKLADDGREMYMLDQDTMLSHKSFVAALKAAGAVCKAVDDVIEGKYRNVFCAIRPPGHHAGPRGAVRSKFDKGTNGFCVLCNTAIGAAYALNMHRNRCKKVAILDFDVHHGNGTQACVQNTYPQTVVATTPHPGGFTIKVEYPSYRPWMGESDPNNIFFASVQGFGCSSDDDRESYFYPGTGATGDNRDTSRAPRSDAAEPTENGNGPTPSAANGTSTATVGTDSSLAEDPNKEFLTTPDGWLTSQGPRIINVGLQGRSVQLWRRAWRDKILPALINFHPDLIILSSGFDAHSRDDVNQGYISVQERDFEWLTEQIMQVANKCCSGRIVSCLEGGYNINGGLVSPFARSVEAHVWKLQEHHVEQWDHQAVEVERKAEGRARAESAARKAAFDAELADEAQALLADAAEHGDAITGGPRKRARGEVNYAELNRKLMEEEASQALGESVAVQNQ